jgi:hypothetical protein
MAPASKRGISFKPRTSEELAFPSIIQPSHRPPMNMHRLSVAEAVSTAKRPMVRTGIRATAVVGLVLILGLFVAGHDRVFTTLSVLDEPQHIDYVDRILAGEIVRRGDRYRQAALEAAACRGILGYEQPPCTPGATYDPRDFAWGGFNTADIHPPTYYFLTAIPARIGLLLGADLTTAARLAGGLWLGSALIILWFVMSWLAIPVLPRVAVLALVATAPTIVHATATVTPDATALLAGAVMIAVTLQWERGSVPALVLAVAATFVVSLKMTNVLSVLACVIYLFIRGWTARTSKSESGTESVAASAGLASVLRASAMLLGGSIVAALTWGVIREVIAVAPTNPMIEAFRTERLGIGQVLGETMAMVSPLRNPVVPPFLLTSLVFVVARLFEVALLAGTFGVLIAGGRIHRVGALAAGGGLTMLAGGSILTVVIFVLGRGFFSGIPPRYGLSLIPFLGVALAGSLKRPTAVSAIVGLAVVSGGVLIVHLLLAL